MEGAAKQAEMHQQQEERMKSPERVLETAIKDERMEVDELREDEKSVTNGQTSGGGSEDIQHSATEARTAPDEVDGSNSSEQQQQQRHQTYDLLKNEQNMESRCSTGSTDDMWRPW